MGNNSSNKSFFGRIKSTVGHITLNDKLRELGEEILEESHNLYDAKKTSLLAIQELHAKILEIRNCPAVIKNGIKFANDEMSTIKDAWDFERNPENNKDVGGKAAVCGMAAGGLTAAVGAPTAMAIATTFGTAATGTAISTLGGAAATNAALAWLGGGAIVAGGGGIAGGLSLLALFGPLGAGIAAGAGSGFVLINRIKNGKEIKKAEDFKALIIEYTKKTKSCSSELKTQIKKIEGNDFLDDKFPKETLFSAVELSKLIGKLSKEAVNKNNYGGNGGSQN